MRHAHAFAALIVIAATAAALTVARAWRGFGAPCGRGFVRFGARCMIDGRCPVPLDTIGGECRPPDRRVLVAAADITIGSPDWEAEGHPAARALHVAAFRIDAFEVTSGLWRAGSDDALRAANGMTREAAARFCADRGGRLPTEDEWTAAAFSSATTPRRYPWGDTGAVCRRAAWGLEHGPCATGATGPDTVGAHVDGDTSLGVHDMAGNVSEWVQADPARPGVAVAKGGSFRTSLASGLRVWARVELPADAISDAVGFRCAYPP
jgi:formylglycine-generating enzyme required for sulfatase activity